MATRIQGTVVCDRSDRGFWFIEDGAGTDYFCHYTDIRGHGYRSLDLGQRVEFEPFDGPRGPAARDLTVLEESGTAGPE